VTMHVDDKYGCVLQTCKNRPKYFQHLCSNACRIISPEEGDLDNQNLVLFIDEARRSSRKQVMH